MALKILIPDNIDNGPETHLSSALQDAGAERISGNEWRFSKKVQSPAEFVESVRGYLPCTKGALADELTVTVFYRKP